MTRPVDSPSPFRLRMFRRSDADSIAGWVSTEKELFHLAPRTFWPLTPDKVVSWPRPGGQAFVYASTADACPVAYGELNPMRAHGDHYWLGHVIVAPEFRGRGLATAFIRALSTMAFDDMQATRLSLVVFPDNEPAIRCYLRTGFRSVGMERHKFNEQAGAFLLERFELAAGDVTA